MQLTRNSESPLNGLRSINIFLFIVFAPLFLAADKGRYKGEINLAEVNTNN